MEIIAPSTKARRDIPVSHSWNLFNTEQSLGKLIDIFLRGFAGGAKEPIYPQIRNRWNAGQWEGFQGAISRSKDIIFTNEASSAWIGYIVIDQIVRQLLFPEGVKSIPAVFQRVISLTPSLELRVILGEYLFRMWHFPKPEERCLRPRNISRCRFLREFALIIPDAFRVWRHINLVWLFPNFDDFETVEMLANAARYRELFELFGAGVVKSQFFLGDSKYTGEDLRFLITKRDGTLAYRRALRAVVDVLIYTGLVDWDRDLLGKIFGDVTNRQRRLIYHLILRD